MRERERDVNAVCVCEEEKRANYRVIPVIASAATNMPYAKPFELSA